MKCKIISITHKPSDWEKQALQFYSKQLPNHFQISYAEIKPFASNSMDVTSSIEAEAAEVLKHVDKNAYVILWDRQGKKINSLGFANLLQDQMDSGNNINFIIGGSHGSSELLFESAQYHK
jgi:23S rRNA pseudoU1915 N3-methylase RlmH